MTGFYGGRRFSFDPPDRPLELPCAEPADSLVSENTRRGQQPR